CFSLNCYPYLRMRKPHLLSPSLVGDKTKESPRKACRGEVTKDFLYLPAASRLALCGKHN
ncbi:MAG: hypothetical protein ACK5WF_06355, partial [Cyclobacteriaceae bacterium]